MSKLEDPQPNATVRGILRDALMTVVNVQWFGSEVLGLTDERPAGKVANELPPIGTTSRGSYRSHETSSMASACT